MAKTKELSKDTRNKIVNLHQAGETESAIGVEVGAHRFGFCGQDKVWLTDLQDPRRNKGSRAHYKFSQYSKPFTTSSRVSLTPVLDYGTIKLKRKTAPLTFQNTSPLTDPAELHEIIVRQGAIIRTFQDQVDALQSQLCGANIAAPIDPPSARKWASAVWDADLQVRSSFAYFAGMIREVFEYPVGGKDISVQLMELRQGSEVAADYAIRFRTLAAQSGWNDAALWAVFHAGLNPVLQAELACHVEATSLSQFMATAIRLDNLRRQHPAGTQASAAARPRVHMDYPDHREEVPEPMQLGRSRLVAQGHRPLGQMRLCYNCGASGHLSLQCPERSSSAQVGSSSLFFNLTVPVSLRFSDRCVPVSALIDSGAAVNLIDGALVEELGIPTFPCVAPLRITAIDSQPIGEGYLRRQTELLEFQVGLFHHEHLAFYVTSLPANPVILGFLGVYVEMDVGKVQAVTEWPAPTTVRELQWFLGFANFYRRFIRNYSSVAGPLTSLLRGKPKKLTWTDQARTAFQQLKNCFTTAPILWHPDPDLPFVVEVDASSSGLGAVLSQHHGEPGKLHPCAFYSRKLTVVEVNYDVGNRELLAIKAVLKEWRHWLEGAHHPFQVLTDHRNLEYLRGAKQLNPWQARWAMFFTRFVFTVTYRPESKNGKADALSRQFEVANEPGQPDLILPATAILAPVQWDLVKEIRWAHADELPPAGCPPTKIFVPQQFRQQVMQWVHEAPSSGHPGIRRSTQRTRRWF
ncbi:hypothetical protein QTP86_007542 [Hemibagrus guttatus]|nr:hypothetical protein QTP86_007542 [Hemibagrus guttatus]